MKKWRERERVWDKETGLSYDTECRKDYAVGEKKEKWTTSGRHAQEDHSVCST